MTVTLEHLRETDREANAELSRLAFGSTQPYDPARPTAPGDHIMAAYLGDELCASATFHVDAQWICGRNVPMGGVAGVAVAPHRRGHGFARAVLRAGMAMMHARGDAMSSLYPTTGTLYRSLGWGYAGSYAWSRVDMSELSPTSSIDGYDLVPSDLALARDLYDEIAPSYNGWLGRSAMHWVTSAYQHRQAEGAHQSYLVMRDASPVGFLAFEASRGGGFRFNATASDLFAVDGDAYRAVFGFIQSMGSMATGLRTRLPEFVLNATLPHPHWVTRTQSHPFMSRIVDARSAVAARGYSPHIRAEIHLDLHDAEIPHNDGPFVLRVRDGVGSLEPGGNAEVPIHIADFSTMFVGGPCTAAALIGVFAAPTTPTLIDFF